MERQGGARPLNGDRHHVSLTLEGRLERARKADPLLGVNPCGVAAGTDLPIGRGGGRVCDLKRGESRGAQPLWA